MKKIILYTITTIVFMSFSSCKKDYECECIATTLNANGNTQTASPQITNYTKIKSSEAKSICQKSVVIYTSNSGSITTTTNDCKLK